MKQFQFTCVEQDTVVLPDEFPQAKTSNITVQFNDGVVWTVVVDQFLGFLSSVYGYDIRDQVEYLSYAEKKRNLEERYGLEEM
jgi:hypothetical protein